MLRKAKENGIPRFVRYLSTKRTHLSSVKFPSSILLNQFHITLNECLLLNARKYEMENPNISTDVDGIRVWNYTPPWTRASTHNRTSIRNSTWQIHNLINQGHSRWAGTADTSEFCKLSFWWDWRMRILNRFVAYSYIKLSYLHKTSAAARIYLTLQIVYNYGKCDGVCVCQTRAIREMSREFFCYFPGTLLP